MNRPAILWVSAFLLTAGTAVYQRLTGPTYPVSGTALVGDEVVSYTFARSHGGSSDHRVAVNTDIDAERCRLEWRRHKTDDPWFTILMARSGGEVVADLPHQPPAGKLQYRVRVVKGEDGVVIPAEVPVIIRFKGDVPLWFIVPHVLTMFLSMFLSARAGLEYFAHGGGREIRMRMFTVSTVALLALGGLVLGPIVQKYAFDAYWTGWPFGGDLTDNKTLVAFLIWVAAWASFGRSRRPERWVLAAAIATLVVFLIPHSLLGSELDYGTLDSPAAPQMPATGP